MSTYPKATCDNGCTTTRLANERADRWEARYRAAVDASHQWQNRAEEYAERARAAEAALAAREVDA